MSTTDEAGPMQVDRPVVGAEGEGASALPPAEAAKASEAASPPEQVPEPPTISDNAATAPPAAAPAPTEPARRVLRARHVLLNSKAITPMQKAVYEQSSGLLSPVESREEVIAMVEGSHSEGWVKINGLTDHVYVKRRLNRDERRAATGYPPFDVKKHLRHIPKRFRPPIDASSHDSDVEALSDAPRKAAFRHNTHKRKRRSSLTIATTVPNPQRTMARRRRPAVKYIDESGGEDEAGPSGSGKGRKKRAVDEDYAVDPEVEEEEEEEDASSEALSEGSGSVVPRRRSARQKRPRKAEGSASHSGSEDPLEAMEETPTRPRKVAKNSRKSRRIASSSEEDEDMLEEEQDAGEVLLRHRDRCDKCLDLPAHKLFAGLKKKRKGRRRKLDEMEETEEDFVDGLGGWLTCSECCSAYHWKCIGHVKRNAMLKSDKERPRDYRLLPDGRLQIDESMTFVCGNCEDSTAGPCFVCNEREVPGTEAAKEKAAVLGSSAVAINADGPPEEGDIKDEANAPKILEQLLFRCSRCHRSCHYEHLERPEGIIDAAPLNAVAEVYQREDDKRKWTCHDCKHWKYEVEHILAWRPSPVDAEEPARGKDDLPEFRTRLPREYLIKWKLRSFRHISWVSHTWILAMDLGRLGRFLREGPSISFKTEAAFTEDLDGERTVADEVFEDAEAAGTPRSLQPVAEADAESKVPIAWKTIDRVLDIEFLVDYDDQQDPESELRVDRLHGELSADAELIGIDDWEKQNRRKLLPDDAEEIAPKIARVFAKWMDLQYDLCTLDTPPPPDTPAWESFVGALRRFLFARTVRVPLPNTEATRVLDARPVGGYKLLTSQPECISGGKLFDFQLEGFNWLMSKWWSRQSCILADDMGVGKTIQIAALLGYMGARYQAYPSLLVVPNSTLTNWVRELEKWVPHLCVVPYFGGADSRAVIRQFELYHAASAPGRSPLKAHVVLTSYNVITSPDFSEFKKIGRWETVIIDEGQRLKSGTAKIVTRLTELHAQCRIVVTGTPLNNTVREILNLLNFLDPIEWKNLDEEEARYAVPDEQTFQELRTRIAPYMLRRKNDVLNLKPKHEIIVPMSMRPLQKQIYKSLLEKNADLMAELAKANAKDTAGDKKPPKVKKLKNLIMQLRKCLQHPYLNVQQLAASDASRANIQQSLVDGSAKLTFLRMLLPQLKAKGHRVLLFSQFVIALDIIQEFCAGEGIETLRMDGTTPQAQRQGDIDRFNAPGSDVPLFMLSTRAGGVGVNLATADVVIIFDPDWNPHMDMQAVARAYRHGQQKNVLVMRFVMKDTVEEKMMQAAKKKLMLDHLIVQVSADDKAEEDFAQIVLDGARALFEKADDDTENDIKWDHDSIAKLITELETREEAPAAEKSGFTFAPIYDSRVHAADGSKGDVAPAGSAAAQDVDYWEEIVRKASEREKQKQLEQYGRGARIRPDKNIYNLGPEADQPSSPTQGVHELADDGEFQANAADSDDSDAAAGPGDDLAAELAQIQPEQEKAVADPKIGQKGPVKRRRRKFVELPPPRDGPPAQAAPLGTSTNQRATANGVAQAAPAAAAAAANNKKPVQSVKRRRISDAALAGGIKSRPWDLAQYHINRLYRYSTNIAPEQGNFLPVLFDLDRHPDFRWQTYMSQAKKIDDILAMNGEEKLFTRTKTLREVQPLIKATPEELVKLQQARTPPNPKGRASASSRQSAPAPTSARAQSGQVAQSSHAQTSSDKTTSRPASNGTLHIASGSRSASNGQSHRANGHAVPPLQTQPRPAAPRVIDLTGPAATPIAVQPAVAQQVCTICAQPGHDLDTCPSLASVERIQKTIEAIRMGQDAEQDKIYAIDWLTKRQQYIREMQSGTSA